MTYLIIDEIDEKNKPSKCNIKETKAEADAIVDKIKATGNTKVFAIETPYAKKDTKYLTVDFINKTVSYDQTAENKDIANAPKQYQIDRAKEYPSIADQLDDIYHNGIDAWKATIKTTKDKYPKWAVY